jgi:SAM-dependent methyltransferase
MKTPCAICGTLDNATEVYPAVLTGELLDEKAFSARRFYHEKIHFRMVRCKSCGLLRSDPIVDVSVYEDLYKKSTLNYDEHIDNLNRTYGYYLRKYAREKGSLLEIGCGNGFFLEEALRQGWKEVAGVEPGEASIAKAKPEIRPHIRQGMFTKEMFAGKAFDVVCIFQTLDHLLEPNKVLADIHAILKPGGICIAINHNEKALSARIFGEKSPIIDIEHTYLYNPKTIRLLFEKNGYAVDYIFFPKSRHYAGYLFSLLPLKPLWLKKALHTLLDFTHISRIPLFIPIGNLGIVARKPYA